MTFPGAICASLENGKRRPTMPVIAFYNFTDPAEADALRAIAASSKSQPEQYAGLLKDFLINAQLLKSSAETCDQDVDALAEYSTVAPGIGMGLEAPDSMSLIVNCDWVTTLSPQVLERLNEAIVEKEITLRSFPSADQEAPYPSAFIPV